MSKEDMAQVGAADAVTSGHHHRIGAKNMNYPDDMDPECIPLCDALNRLPGIETVESCCGHGKEPFWICFTVDRVDHLKPILHNILNSPWDVRVSIIENSVYFVLEGPIGPADMLLGANDIAADFAGPP